MNNTIFDAMMRLRQLGVDTSELNQDYYKIPLENTDLSKIEREHPTKAKINSKHTIIVDSRQRDYSIYSHPNNYLINLSVPYRNVEKIELIAAMLPKTEYNVISENNLILLTIDGIQEPLLLTPGQYSIGSNEQGKPDYISSGYYPINGVIAEVKRVLNTHPLSGNSFNVFLATVPPPNGTGKNASVLNRILITNDLVHFSIDFTNTNYSSGSPFRLLGFQKDIIWSVSTNVIYGSNNYGNCTSSELQIGTTHTVNIPSIQSIYDYDLQDDPQYIIMQLVFGNKTADRIESSDIATNQKFAVILYDSNDPDNISSYDSSTLPGNNVQFKTDRKTGRLKALKGADFDKKIISFDPPITLESLTISFNKYDNTLYNFHNREHLLTFELDVAEFDPRYKY